MDELKFVLRCFGFAALFLVLTQIKAGDMTIENHIESSLVNSRVSSFVNKVAEGGVKLIKDSGHYVHDAYQDWKHKDSTETNTQQAQKSHNSDEMIEPAELE